MGKTTLALVGSDSLLGREIRDIVATSAPEFGLRLIAADAERPGTLTRMGDEPAMLTQLDARGLDDVSAVLLAGSAESSGKALGLLANHSTPAIDLTAFAEEYPGARLRAPMVERDAGDDARSSPSSPPPRFTWWRTPPPSRWRCSCGGCTPTTPFAAR